MPQLTENDIVIEDSWYEGDLTGKLKFKCIIAKFVSGVVGGQSNRIVPEAFGLSKFVSAEFLPSVSDQYANHMARVAADGTRVLLYPSNGTVLTALPADLEMDQGEFKILVKGIE